MNMATIEDFQKIDIRVGRIIEVSDFPEAKQPSYKLKIDFGEQIGIKQSSAHLCRYTKDELNGRLILAVINFSPRQIGKFMSEVLVLGVPVSGEECVLVQPEQEVEIGGRLY